jgi:hypothetical protein
VPDEERDQQAVMDAEAVRARRELEPSLDQWNARDLIKWWARWYSKAGHKRLGRVLVDLSKKNETA